MFMFSRSGKIIPVARDSSVEVKENALYDYTEPIKGHGGGEKRLGFFFFLGGGGGGIFVKKKMRSLKCSPQTFCVLSQNQLSSDKHLLYRLQWFIQLHAFTM